TMLPYTTLFRSEREHVLGLDLVRVEVDLDVGRAAAAARALGVEREDLYPRPDELLEAGHELGVLPVRLLPRLEPVLVVHVEDEVHRAARLDRAAEEQPRQEALARAGLAEDGVGALDEPREV